MKKKLVTEPRELVLLLFVMTSTLIYKGDERRRYVFWRKRIKNPYDIVQKNRRLRTTI